MLPDLCPLQLLIVFLCSVCFEFGLLYGKETFFLIQCIWCSVSFLYLHRDIILLVGKIFFYDFVEYIFCAFELEFFPSSIPIILMFGLFMVSRISWMFSVRNLLDLMFYLINEMISSLYYLQHMRFSLLSLVSSW